ncbi:MAG: hypothetical protein KUG77_08340 [Nannocystaceae bacterium]|nr:hypothetical protein [Nannocystaceae bacterium]
MTHILSLLIIASQLLTTPTDDPASSSMRKPVEIKHKSQAGQSVIEGVSGILAEKLGPLDRRRLGSKVLSASRVSIASGTFAGGSTRLVAVNVNLRMKDPAATQQYISGVFTVTNSGGLIAVIVPPRMRPERFEFEKVGDTDGDGSDDFVYTAANAEETTRHRVTWNGTEAISKTLTNAGPAGEES